MDVLGATYTQKKNKRYVYIYVCTCVNIPNLGPICMYTYIYMDVMYPRQPRWPQSCTRRQNRGLRAAAVADCIVLHRRQAGKHWNRYMHILF